MTGKRGKPALFCFYFAKTKAPAIDAPSPFAQNAALPTHPATNMMRTPLLILIHRQRASAGRVCLPHVVFEMRSI